jgi:protein SCO1/2
VALAWWPGLRHYVEPLSAVGGPFALQNPEGQPFTDRDLLGRPTAIVFGYTHCPDVCPTTLTAVSGWIAALGPDAGRVRFVFVTVDPVRDTGPVLADYMRAFDSSITALTGSPEAVTAMTAAYRVGVRRSGETEGDYLVDHAALIYLMDAEGRFRQAIRYDDPLPRVLASLRTLIDDH